jgi:type IV pilus assembly protein PilY1
MAANGADRHGRPMASSIIERISPVKSKAGGRKRTGKRCEVGTMKAKRAYNMITGLMLASLLLCTLPAAGDDTCIFAVTANDVPPYIVLLLDNGAEMEQILWPAAYDPNTDYTPAAGVFTNPGGYALEKSGNDYYLYEIDTDLSVSSTGIEADTSDPIWTINGHTITLPAFPSSSVDAAGIKDNASQFRYATNYLNWLFYSGEYTGNGSDLPTQSRFYKAKEAIFQVARLTGNRAKFGINNFTANASGASNVQPLGMVVDEPAYTELPQSASNVLDSNFINNVNNMGTVTHSPLAEGLASVGGYYASSSSHVVDNYCGKLFSMVISPGVSSEDQSTAAQSTPGGLADFDGDNNDASGASLVLTDTSGTTTYTIPTHVNGSTYLDDVAAYHYSNDIVGYAAGFQRVNTYTVGFMGSDASNAFLTNVSNNGNGNINLYDRDDPEYGAYHYEAQDPDALADKIMEAIEDILRKTTIFTAPVVPVTRTTSGDSIYLALFKPTEGNFWEGNLAKYGLGTDNGGQAIIVDSNGDAATWPNGALKETASPYWETIDWADPAASNYVHNQSRAIYTGLGSTSITSTTNAFSTTNGSLADWILGYPTDVTVNSTVVDGVTKVIDYIRGADVLDEDGDGNTTENRAIITGDILHGEPAVVNYDNTSFTGSAIFYGANDGMLHAVRDSDGTEMWGFIPTDLLPKLKDIIEGASHQYYVDASPKVFINNGNQDTVVDNGEQAILVFGERAGGSCYWALDITNPTAPEILWAKGPAVNLDLGETWSEPVFTRVKTSAGDTTGTPVMVVGGGYSATNADGQLIAFINVLTGALVKRFDSAYNSDMVYSIPSQVNVVDIDNNGLADKVYVGDMGGQLIRLGRFTEDDGTTPLFFLDTNENINDWGVDILFDTDDARKFYYPPTVTLEKGFDLVFIGSGDRNNACSTSSSDRIYVVKDDHTDVTFGDADLIDLTDPNASAPTFPSDNGYYLPLATGEKILAKGMVFNSVYYITSFTPGNSDPCMPGGSSRLYALGYKTGEAVIDFDGDGQPDRSTEIGGGIPSKPVMIIPPDGDARLLISVGSTIPDINSEETTAGIAIIDPVLPSMNFFYLWWRDT